jgi:hypothetical protein
VGAENGVEEDENGYTLAGRRGRKSGKRDPYQKWLSKTYHTLVREVIESNNWGLNLNQITAKLGELLTPEFRKRLEDEALKPGWKMPKGKPTRKSVGEHLSELCADPKTQVARIGGRYYIVDSSSTQLNASVRQVLQKKNMIEYNISPARNVAGCYTFTDPLSSAGLFIDLFNQQVERFIDSGYWLEDILAHMVRYNLFSNGVYSKENGLDKRTLRDGWERCFGNTRLLVLTCAISPPDFLDYMLSRHGNRWAMSFLEKRWDAIMEKAAKNPASELEAMALSVLREGTYPLRR